MKWITAAHSDVGIRKKTNQDSYCVKIAEIPEGEAALFVICDGMGGLDKGELASATMIRALSDWFEVNLPGILDSGYSNDAVRKEWDQLMRDINEEIGAYGARNHIQLGTTVTAMLSVAGNYIIGHVGDSRAYKVDSELRQLTEDQTVVQRDINLGLITKEQGRQDPRQNVLLQCVGASSVVVPAFSEGTVRKGDLFMLCSDGFRHKIEDGEMQNAFSGERMTDESQMKESLVNLTELNKSRMERDNITAMLVKAV